MSQKTYDLMEQLVKAQREDCLSRSAGFTVIQGDAYSRTVGNIQAILKTANTIADIDRELELVIKYINSNIKARDKSAEKG